MHRDVHVGYETTLGREMVRETLDIAFNLYRQDEIERFYHWLYDGATICLKRKKDIFDSHIHEPIDRRDSPTSIGNIGEPGGNDLAADSAA